MTARKDYSSVGRAELIYENHVMNENLSTVQERCTSLMLENQALRRKLRTVLYSNRLLYERIVSEKLDLRATSFVDALQECLSFSREERSLQIAWLIKHLSDKEEGT